MFIPRGWLHHHEISRGTEAGDVVRWGSCVLIPQWDMWWQYKRLGGLTQLGKVKIVCVPSDEGVVMQVGDEMGIEHSGDHEGGRHWF